MKDVLPWLPLVITAITMALSWQKLTSAVEGIDKSIAKLNDDAKRIPEIETTQKLQAQDHAHTRHTLTEHEKKTSGEFVRLEQLTRERTHKINGTLQVIENRFVGLDARVKSLEEQKPVLKAVQALEEVVIRRTTVTSEERKK